MPWLKLLRPYQWSKNLLVFTVVLAGHHYGDASVLWPLLQCFACYCLMASAGYIVNDLKDIADDRNHPVKRHRPIAAGQVSPGAALALAFLMVLAGFYLAWSINLWVLASVSCYLLTTLLYSVWLKRKLLLDVVVLAGLDTVRIIGGAAAVGIEPSFWLLAFAMFLFSSLAILKRYIELRERPVASLEAHSVRAYRPEEQYILASLGIANGSLAVLVLAFYMNSPAVQAMYRSVLPLWFLCPILMYWIGRIWLLASRSLVSTDPILFALKDRLSYMIALVCLVLIGLAK
jgi:4-hydroxybenzoate polyprenyltransferase